MAIEQILLSPGFQRDRTAFSRSRHQEQVSLYRSTDGGATWNPLEVNLSLVAMSPEFDRDGVLMGVFLNQIVVSNDRGETWERVGSVPEGDEFRGLSLAPLFRRWHVAFAFGIRSQNLYRSVDGGQSWDAVLFIGGRAFGQFPPQIAYGPEPLRSRNQADRATGTSMRNQRTGRPRPVFGSPGAAGRYVPGVGGSNTWCSPI